MTVHRYNPVRNAVASIDRTHLNRESVLRDSGILRIDLTDLTEKETDDVLHALF